MTSPKPHAAFAETALRSARTFRKILDAMARPGTLHVMDAVLPPPPGLSPAAAATLLTLSDADAPAWLAEGRRTPQADAFLRFHTGAGPAARRSGTAFAVGRWAELGPPDPADLGTPDYPDRSVTLIVEVDALRPDAGVRLSGPGVAGARLLEVDGVDAAFWDALRANRDTAPLGFDVILTAGATLAALPRSVRLDG